MHIRALDYLIDQNRLKTTGPEQSISIQEFREWVEIVNFIFDDPNN